MTTLWGSVCIRWSRSAFDASICGRKARTRESTREENVSECLVVDRNTYTLLKAGPHVLSCHQIQTRRQKNGRRLGMSYSYVQESFLHRKWEKMNGNEQNVFTTYGFGSASPLRPQTRAFDWSTSSQPYFLQR
jgi:hypothetical protein